MPRGMDKVRPCGAHESLSLCGPLFANAAEHCRTRETNAKDVQNSATHVPPGARGPLPAATQNLREAPPGLAGPLLTSVTKPLNRRQ